MALIEEMFKESQGEAKNCLERYLDGKFNTEKFQLLIDCHKLEVSVIKSILRIVVFGAKHGKRFINHMMATKIDSDTTLFDIATVGITQGEMQAMADAEFKGMLKKRAQWMKQELKGLHQVIKEMTQAVHATG